MASRTWLLLCALLAGTAGCASGAGGSNLDTDASASVRADGGDDRDADGEPEEDAAEPPDDAGGGLDAAQEGGLDASDDASSDARAPDATQPDADTPEASTPDTGAPDAGAPDTAVPDAGRPTSKPLPSGEKFGEWTWVKVDGSFCRDGSPAGYYHRRGNDNLMIFLNGSGACMDKFFCGLIPKNVDESMYQETLFDTTLNALTSRPTAARQTPPNEGIFKADARNPVAGWSMIFVPYCTGDVHAGQNPNGMVPEAGPQKFVGYTNLGLFLESFGPSFVDTQRVLLAGSGAGGFGVLLNFDRVQRFFDAQGAKVNAITDSGIPFQDAYLEACLQKRWRDLWNLNASLPTDCNGCRNADGGGLATGLGSYIFKQKYASRMLGGVITSNQDEIVKVFFSAGLNGCTVDTGAEALAQTLGLGSYPSDRFPKGVNDVITNVAGADNVGYYIINGSRHMHLMRSRYYEPNGVGQSIADWVADVLAGKPTHRGTL